MKNTSNATTPWSPAERRILARLTTPMKIQQFVDSLLYSEEDCYRCPRRVMLDRKGHCYDGAVLAAAALREIGNPPMLMELIPNNRDDDHIVAPFKIGGCWGAVAKSNFSGLRYREPVYRTLRELAMSYFEGFFNMARERTMRAYGAPLYLRQFDRLHWLTEDRAMDVIADAMGLVRRHDILRAEDEPRLTQVDDRSFQAGILGLRKAGVYKVDGGS
jgi:hypothetical protein